MGCDYLCNSGLPTTNQKLGQLDGIIFVHTMRPLPAGQLHHHPAAPPPQFFCTEQSELLQLRPSSWRSNTRNRPPSCGTNHGLARILWPPPLLWIHRYRLTRLLFSKIIQNWRPGTKAPFGTPNSEYSMCHWLLPYQIDPSDLRGSGTTHHWFLFTPLYWRILHIIITLKDPYSTVLATGRPFL